MCTYTFLPSLFLSLSLSFSDPVSRPLPRRFPRGSADTEHENGRTPVKTSTWWGCHGNIQYVLQVDRLLKTSSLGQSASLSTLRPRTRGRSERTDDTQRAHAISPARLALARGLELAAYYVLGSGCTRARARWGY